MPVRSRTQDRPVLSIAHRGASWHAPENTLAAVRAAVALGVDLVEVDLQRTRDGALVLMHDVTLARTTDVRARHSRRAPWRVADLTLEELRRLDAGSWFSRRYAGERVPTLAELLDTLRGTGVGLQLELKRPDLHPGVVADLAAQLAVELGDAPTVAGVPVVVQSFDVAAMKELKTRLPPLRVGILGRPAVANLAALATWADQVNPAHLAADAAYVRAVHALGMECLVWTVDRTGAQRRALRHGVDGIITNRPDRLAEVLRSTVAAHA
ncbi:glycerophosphodiester phosphodiesterase [Nocardioides caldifontis]|uniref:glycerophosphodiester phosphodiesterase n=1 Tax=Nocardioides caldifontis TaxID=2588938 RepID=UPI00193AC4C6|nr:glycerophosphodiester phosphodiesterase family protein [Nocardioides caldifontis]